MNTPQKLSPRQVAGLIKELGSFYFMPNFGNYGDLLIAEGIRDFFKDNGIGYEELPKDNPPRSYNLVYGGGGIFVKQWISYLDTDLLTGPQVGRCLLLPCSIRDVDGFVDKLDERHTVLCRESETYLYCTGLNQRARFYMADDMALQLHMPSVLADEPGPVPVSLAGARDEAEAQRLLADGFARKVADVFRFATVRASLHGGMKGITFILRTDTEAVSGPETQWFTDVSRMYNASCCTHRYNKILLQIMARNMDKADAVVSNRLHVCIMAHLLGKEVYMLDNSYGKLAGVYGTSLADCPNVHYIGTAPLPADIQRALDKLNGWYSRLHYRLVKRLQRARHKAGILLHKLHLR